MSLLVDIAGVAAELGVSERQAYLLRKREDFPEAICLGTRTVRYRRADLERFIETLATATPSSEPAQLASGKAKRAGVGS